MIEINYKWRGKSVITLRVYLFIFSKSSILIRLMNRDIIPHGLYNVTSVTSVTSK